MPEQVILDFGGGLNLTAASDLVPEREALIADNCRFDELGTVAAAGATSRQNTSAYSESARTTIHSLWVNPVVKHVAGLGHDVFVGNSLASLVQLLDEVNTTEEKMSFAEHNQRVYFDTAKTPRFVDSNNVSTKIDWVLPATSAATGPNSAGAGASVVRGGVASPKAWVNPGNILTSNDVYATCPLSTVPTSFYSDYLKSDTFGFAIGGTPDVLGIKVEAEVSHSGGNASNITLGYAVLLDAGVAVGDTLQIADLRDVSSTDAYYTAGGDGVLWGYTGWTVAKLNAATFGCYIYFDNWQGNPGTISVDHVRITVYTASGGISVALGGAGNPNGTYTYKVTFKASSGEEGEQSPASASIAPVNQIVNLSAIPTGDARTTGRFVYRKGALLTSYYQVGEISDNSSTTFSDNMSDTTALTTGILLAGEADGDEPNTRFGLNTKAKYPALYYDRLFWALQEATVKNRILWSKPLNHFAYPVINFIDVGDAKAITGLVPFLDDFIIFKTDSIWRLTGSSEESFQLTRTPVKFGTDMPFTIVKMQERIMFANDAGFWFFNGITAQPVTNRLLRFFDGQTVNGIAPPLTSDSVTQNFSADSEGNFYYLAYADTGTQNNRILKMDFDGGTIVRLNPTAKVLSLAADSTTQAVYVGTQDGFISKIDDTSATNDSTSSVTWTFQTKYFDQSRGNNKCYWGLEFDINTGGQTITPTVLYNGGSSSEALSTISTSSRARVFRVLSATASRKARNISIRFSGTLATVNSSNSPAVILYGMRLSYIARKQQVGVAVA